MTKKPLKLRLDALQISSFEVQPREGGRGTVMGHATEESFYGTCDAACEPSGGGPSCLYTDCNVTGFTACRTACMCATTNP